MVDQERKNVALLAINQASSCLMTRFGSQLLVDTKPGGSLVSDVDRAVNDIIVGIIGSCFPDDGILSEESPAKLSRSGYRWIVDPLDGSRNYSIGSHDFGVGIAIEYNERIELGICSFPMYSELICAERGKGAVSSNRLGKLNVSDAKKLLGGIFYPDSNFRRVAEESLGDIKALVEAGCSIRINGCSHLAMTQVASGRALIAVSHSAKLWDLAPVVIAVEEAGGKVTNRRGQPWNLGDDIIVATNGIVHDEVIKLVNR